MMVPLKAQLPCCYRKLLGASTPEGPQKIWNSDRDSVSIWHSLKGKEQEFSESLWMESHGVSPTLACQAKWTKDGEGGRKRRLAYDSVTTVGIGDKTSAWMTRHEIKRGEQRKAGRGNHSKMSAFHSPKQPLKIYRQLAKRKKILNR